MDFTLHVWRQKDANSPGKMVTYRATDIHPNMSFIEMLDVTNVKLTEQGDEPVAYEADCLEGICGTCCLVINGVAHGPEQGVTTCQLHMRSFQDGDHIYIEPFRARAFPPIKDLVVNREALDRINQAWGFISVGAGGAPDGNAMLIAKDDADTAFDAAQCVQCGACVASCKNGSAMLFVAAKVAHLSHLPQGQPEREQRVINMVRAMDEEGFGACTNQYECEAVCPKEIPAIFIAELNRELRCASLKRAKA